MARPSGCRRGLCAGATTAGSSWAAPFHLQPPQLGARPALDQTADAQRQNPVGVAHRGQAMADEERGTVPSQPAVIAHRNKDVRPAGRAIPILLVPRHPVLGPSKPAELLGVQAQGTREPQPQSAGAGLGPQNEESVEPPALRRSRRAPGDPTLRALAWRPSVAGEAGCPLPDLIRGALGAST